MMEVGVVYYHDNASKYMYMCLMVIGVNLKISVVDLSTGEVGPAEPMRVEEGWIVGELKQHIGEVRGRIYCHLYCSPPSIDLVHFFIRYLISIHHV